MSRTFNITADCKPSLHYMVDITDRLEQIKKMIDAGQYFTINRARQYGKTTILRALAKYLVQDYVVVSLDFLSQLRGYYIDRDVTPAFQSVILAGVYDIKNIKRIQIIACGTSLHAGLVGKYVLEEITGIPVDVEASSEYIYRSTIADKNTLVIGISQSGETADTITAIKQVKKKGAHVLIITNRNESMLARLSDSLLHVNAGIEVSVAATKSYIAQLISIYLLAIFMAQTLDIKTDLIKDIKHELLILPSKLEAILSNCSLIREVAKKYSSYKNFIFIARGINYPTALEGALKLKEISYINATGYPAGELKHGPIAMLDETMPVLAILNEGIVYDKVMSNCEEAYARQAKLIGVANHIDDKYKKLFDDYILIPDIKDIVSPALNVTVLQLLAYYIAEYLGKDVDQPRNLAKSVTVE